MTKAEAMDLLRRGETRAVVATAHLEKYHGKAGRIVAVHPEFPLIQVEIDGESKWWHPGHFVSKPAPRPWQPGDPAVTDAYTQGRTDITLVRRLCPTDGLWLVKPGDDGAPIQTLYEEEFRRPKPAVDLFAPATEPEPDRPFKGMSVLLTTRAEIDEFLAKQSAACRQIRESVIQCKPDPREPSIECEQAIAKAHDEIVKAIFSGGEPRAWRPGDRVLDRRGQTRFLIKPHAAGSKWWIVATPEGGLTSIDTENAMYHPQQPPIPAGSSPALDTLRRMKKKEQGEKAAVVNMVLDLKRGGIDAVLKHLPALLESYGVARDEAAAIIAQVEAGHRATRETASIYTTIRGVIDWQQEDSRNRRVYPQVTGHVLLVHATELPDLAPRRVKFCTGLNADAAAIILSDACRSGSDLTVSREDDRIVVERRIRAEG